MRIQSKDEKETIAIAARLARRARPGVICLRGPLGGGKTTFVRGFLRGLGHRGAVPSPTFALINEYPKVKPRVYHLDLYRIKDKSDLENLGLEDYLEDSGAVSLIEWPEIANGVLPRERIDIAFEHARDGGRTLSFKAFGSEARALLKALKRKGR